jgi:hypothetical protein
MDGCSLGIGVFSSDYVVFYGPVVLSGVFSEDVEGLSLSVGDFFVFMFRFNYEYFLELVVKYEAVDVYA